MRKGTHSNGLAMEKVSHQSNFREEAFQKPGRDTETKKEIVEFQQLDNSAIFSGKAGNLLENPP